MVRTHDNRIYNPGSRLSSTMRHYGYGNGPVNATDVTPDDAMVFDNAGSIWVYSNERWRYLTDAGLTNWDSRYQLPEEYEPYTRLDANARSLIKNTLLRTHYCLAQ